MDQATYQLFLRTLWVQSESTKTERMTQHVVEEATSLGAERVVVSDGNVYVTKGNAEVFPTYVAHTDTVHDIVPDDEYEVWRQGDRYYGMNPKTGNAIGVGGDDKVGVFLALAMLRFLPNVKLAFFRDEEIGCVGSSRADMAFFSDSAFVLQADRRGYGEFVHRIGGHSLYGKEFSGAMAPYLERYGMREVWGSISDVGALKDSGLCVVAANVACGYHLPHTPQEYIKRGEVERVMAMFRRVGRELGDRQWRHEPKVTIVKRSVYDTQTKTTRVVEESEYAFESIYGRVSSARTGDTYRSGWGDDWTVGRLTDPYHDWSKSAAARSLGSGVGNSNTPAIDDDWERGGRWVEEVPGVWRRRTKWDDLDAADLRALIEDGAEEYGSSGDDAPNDGWREAQAFAIEQARQGKFVSQLSCPTCHGQTILWDDVVEAGYCVGQCDTYTIYDDGRVLRDDDGEEVEPCQSAMVIG